MISCLSEELPLREGSQHWSVCIISVYKGIGHGIELTIFPLKNYVNNLEGVTNELNLKMIVKYFLHMWILHDPEFTSDARKMLSIFYTKESQDGIENSGAKPIAK